MAEADCAKIKELEEIAKELRLDLIEMFRSSGKGHLGGSLSIVEIITALYFHFMDVRPGEPRWPERDRLVLSKGHASAAWYAALAKKGFFRRELLFTDYIKINGILQEHSDMKKVPGVEMSSGALGQGLSVGLGMALAGRLSGADYRVYVILGDGEMQEGQVWEALMACSNYRTGRLTAIIDYNKLQVCNSVSSVMEIEPLKKKLEAFRWNVLEIDGNSMSEVFGALRTVKNSSSEYPFVVIANTVKGKGVSFIENQVSWHSHAFSEDHYRQAMLELSRGGKE